MDIIPTTISWVAILDYLCGDSCSNKPTSLRIIIFTFHLT